MTGKVATSRFITRPARREDHPAFARFWDELQLQQVVPDIDYWDEHLRPKTIFLEAPNGELAAYALTFPFGERGDVRQIAVAPEFRGQGVGKEIMRVVASRFREAGVRDWRLEVRANNAAGIACYRSVGMEILHEMETVRITREIAERIAVRGPVELVDPSEDEAIEVRWDLGRGQMQRWRKARPTALMWQVRDRGLTHYQPTYAPMHGLMFPFRAADAEAGAMLIGAARDHGIEHEVESLLVDPPVIQAFREAGARNVETLYEMGGPLPPAP
jgi:ribosomal protein S18 acetylase RimI-like enzyme